MYAAQVSQIRRYQSLREAYEAELGERISDRTWQRIKSPQQLCFEDEHFHRLEDIRIAARMRRVRPKTRINVITVRRIRRVVEQFPDGVCLNGTQLYESVCKVLGYEVPRQTMYRWGSELVRETRDRGCRFSKRQHAWYSPAQVKAWAKKIAPSVADLL